MRAVPERRAREVGRGLERGGGEVEEVLAVLGRRYPEEQRVGWVEGEVGWAGVAHRRSRGDRRRV